MPWRVSKGSRLFGDDSLRPLYGRGKRLPPLGEPGILPRGQGTGQVTGASESHLWNQQTATQTKALFPGQTANAAKHLRRLLVCCVVTRVQDTRG